MVALRLTSVSRNSLNFGTWVIHVRENDGPQRSSELDAGKKFSTESYEQVLDVFDNAKKVVEDGKSRLQKMIKTA